MATVCARKNARDGVDGESADRERRFVDVSERAVESLARAHMQVRRVLEVLRDARVERAEPDARAEDPESNQAVATCEECLMIAESFACAAAARYAHAAATQGRPFDPSGSRQRPVPLATECSDRAAATTAATRPPGGAAGLVTYENKSAAVSPRR